jgi:hypothetical protein
MEADESPAAGVTSVIVGIEGAGSDDTPPNLGNPNYGYVSRPSRAARRPP